VRCLAVRCAMRHGFTGVLSCRPSLHRRTWMDDRMMIARGTRPGSSESGCGAGNSVSCLRALALKEQSASHERASSGLASGVYASRLGWLRRRGIVCCCNAPRLFGRISCSMAHPACVSAPPGTSVRCEPHDQQWRFDRAGHNSIEILSKVSSDI